MVQVEPVQLRFIDIPMSSCTKCDVIMGTSDTLIRKAPDDVKMSYTSILDYLHNIKEHNYLLDDWD